MKKPYVKRYAQISGFDVWVVDGKYVRTFIDEEFTNFGQHYRFNFIPENEFWIDAEHGSGSEMRFYIDHLLTEHRLMKKGTIYSEALEAADAKERAERGKLKFVKSVKKSGGVTEVISKIHKKLLKKYSEKMNVWIVRGDLVRDLFYVDFTEGGHDKVYSFVPAKEVWLDDDLPTREMKFVLLHELHERNLMAKGMKYYEAHDSSSEIEYKCRRNPALLDAAIEKEMNSVKLK